MTHTLTTTATVPTTAQRINDLRARDNWRNALHIGHVYLIIATTVAGMVCFAAWLSTSGFSWWWNLPVFCVALLIMGASQHQFGGAVHEATHYMLFKNRVLNEVVSDWLCAFPLYTSTYQYRVHHLAHHHFVNDPDRDPDIAQLHDSGHWLDFPVTHVTFLWALLKQLWLPNLIRYTLTRARYSSLGGFESPYHDPQRRPSRWPTRVGILYAVVGPLAFGRAAHWGGPAILCVVTLGSWLAVVGYLYLTPESRFPATRIQPIISHRATMIGRVTFLAALYSALSWSELLFGWHTGTYFMLLWIVPLFTTFPLFMMLRQWVQHGNADRGRLTNTRVFKVNPLLRYAVFPFGMDYHLPHHLYASVPHYRLHALHEMLQADPDYVRDGIIVENYCVPAHGAEDHPTVVQVLGQAYRAAGNEVYIDEHALDDAEVI